jgi:ubiquinone/menaquinone biosynthesis C-methylase UbiE
MRTLKPRLKKIIEKTAGTHQIKQLHFRFEKTIRFFNNLKFRKKNPLLAIPPDQWLFETFQLNYQKYFEDGDLAAKEIWHWTKDLLPNELPTILDWGCGTGRIVQHLHKHHPYLLLYGADINKDMIAWNHQNIKDVHFSNISLTTPTNYPGNYFDLIYGVSVFTHTPSNNQLEWINEMQRIIKPSGIFLVTTMGSYFNQQLLSDEIKLLDENGIFEKVFHEKKIPAPGNRNYSVYETTHYFEKIISTHFNILQYYDGILFPEKFGGQDLWILQKK